jgi:hypothetical protein
VPGGILGFEARHIENVAQGIEPVLACQFRKLGTQFSDIIRRRCTLQGVAACSSRALPAPAVSFIIRSS